METGKSRLYLPEDVGRSWVGGREEGGGGGDAEVPRVPAASRRGSLSTKKKKRS